MHIIYFMYSLIIIILLIIWIIIFALLSKVLSFKKLQTISKLFYYLSLMIIYFILLPTFKINFVYLSCFSSLF